MNQISLDHLFADCAGAPNKGAYRHITLCPTPHPDESLISLLARTAAAKHFDDPSWLRGAARIDRKRSGLWSDAQVDAMASLLRLPAAEVAQRAFSKVGKVHRFFGSTISRRHFNWNGIKVCPHCLDERGYHSAVFNLHAIRHCPLHGVPLIEHCEGCAAPIAFRGPDLFRCPQCKADFRKMSAQPANLRKLEYDAYLAKKAGFPNISPSFDQESLGLIKIFDQLSVGNFIEVTIALGSCQEALLTDARVERCHPANWESWNAARDGWELLRGWPDRFFDFLDRVSQQKSDADGMAYGARATFKPLYDFLAAADGPHWRTVRRAFEIYLRDHWHGFSHPSRKNARIEIARPNLFTQFESALEIQRRKRMRSASLKALVRTGTIQAITVPPRSGLGKAASVFVDRAALQDISTPQNPLRNLKEAAAYFGLSLKLTKRLADSHVIQAVDGPHISGASRYLFMDNELRDACRRLFSTTVSQATRPNGTITLPVLLKRQSASRIPLKDVAEAITTGEICSVQASMITAILPWHIVFYQDEVDHWFRRNIARAAPEAIRTQEVMERLGVNKGTVAYLVGAGWLTEHHSVGRLRMISLQSVEEFEEQWVKLGEIAELVASNRSLVRRALDHAGVASIDVPKDANGITVFYDRRQVERLDIEQLCQQVCLHKGKSWAAYSSGLAQRKSATGARQPM